MRVGIIGAGPAGITAAYRLAKSGVDVEVFEAAPQVGGLARSINLWNQTVDIGPHRFFSRDRRVNELWLEVVGTNYRMVDRLTRIYYKDRFYDYPLRPLNVFQNLGPVEVARCIFSYLGERMNPSAGDCDSFEDWVVSRFGRRLFEIFFKTYSEKLWGISCQDLDAAFAAQRINKFSLVEAIKSALRVGRAQHKTLVESFAYPLGGTGSVYQSMAQSVTASGGVMHLASPIVGIVREGNRVVALKTREQTHFFDQTVSTMPLTLLVKGLDPPEPVKEAASKLTFRNTIIVFLNVEGTSLFPDQWLYVHSSDLRLGRLTNFRNWVPELFGDEKTTILAAEFWCYPEDDIWTFPDDQLIALAKRELASTGLVPHRSALNGHVERLPRCYPVYARGYRNHVRVLSDFVDSFENLLAIGRYGAFKYNNQDHSILMGILAAQNVAEGTCHNLWEVNADSEYQEATLISATGLESTGE